MFPSICFVKDVLFVLASGTLAIASPSPQYGTLQGVAQSSALTLSPTVAASTALSASPATTAISVSGVTTASPGSSFTLTGIFPSTSTPPPLPKITFPPVGSIPRDFSDNGMSQLWNLVETMGSITPPPFTTTPVPSTPVILPSPPPALYPSWYAPQPTDIMPNLLFPEGFKFGVATAAFQVEGAAKSEGKGPTVWDWAARFPGFIQDGTNGDITDLQYFLYKEDTARTAALGATAHSFSISWARIFPFGVKDSPVNQQGLDHYSDLIDYSWSLGVEPVVTLFHWDTPLALSAYYGGFTSPEIVDDFVNYAVTIFKAYNGRVKTWYTFNEPTVYCGQVASTPFNVTLFEGVNATNAFYVCSHNLLKAHAGAVKAFRALNISGEIAFKNSGETGIPWRSNSTDDAEAVERSLQFGIGMYSDPVYLTGDWPDLVKETLPESILPRFTPDEMQDIKGSADFYAIDSYTNSFIRAPPNGIQACIANMSDPFWPSCNEAVQFDSNAGWSLGPYSDKGSPWLIATPQTLRTLLTDVQKRWPTNKMYIAEYGFTEPFETQVTDHFRVTTDSDRTNYFMTYLGEALLSIHEDGVPLAGAFSWAMVDNVEWNLGLSTRFGIQYVNYTTLERSYKTSAIALSQFFKSHLVGNGTV